MLSAGAYLYVRVSACLSLCAEAGCHRTRRVPLPRLRFCLSSPRFFENQLRLYVPRASDSESIGRRERDCDGAVRQAGFRRFIIGLPKVPRGMFERRITVPYRGRVRYYAYGLLMGDIQRVGRGGWGYL